MSDILDKFNILSKVSLYWKKVIKIFHVFDDQKGYNVLFITSDDKVFGFGSNTFGCCGLGHNSVVNEPQVITELCEQNIRQFFIGLTFVLALSENHKLFGWGRNNFGQLGRGCLNNETIYMRPEIIDFKNESIITLSCGSDHTLALTLEGKVYGWGRNSVGQVGCGRAKGTVISNPILIQVFENILIKSIYCSFAQSFALTNDGLVYSWGYNNWCELGHQLDKNEIVFKPKLIKISNIVSVCPSSNNTYFLTKRGIIYFCGYIENEKFQKTPILLNRSIKFYSLYSAPIYRKGLAISLAVSEKSINYLKNNILMKIQSKDIIQYYCKEWNVCHKTIQICDEFEYKESQLSLNKTLSEMNSRFDELFAHHQKLGTGGFGVVYKAQNIIDNKLFAIKKISTEIRDGKIEDLIREVDILTKCSAEYVVQYFDSWIENNNCLYIQMELCSDNLKNVIIEKAEYFGRGEDQPMTAIEYYISCQLFKEVLECVQYLHESNPKIMHRDIKPENILINENTKNHRFLKLCDFGLAKVIESSTIKTNTGHQGTFRYIAPEISKSNPRYNEKVDIYSLGILLQDLFGFDLNGSENQLKRSLKQELLEMTTDIVDRDYKNRPTCAHMLSCINKWSNSPDDLVESDFSYSRVFSKNSFFKMYFNSILSRILIQNKYEDSLENVLITDIIFVVNDQQIHCNKMFLQLKCEQFKWILQEPEMEVSIFKDLNHDAFSKMIDFLYFGENVIIERKLSIKLLSDIYKCGEKFKIIPLLQLIQREMKDNINMEEFKEIYEFAKQFNLQDIMDLSRIYLKDNVELLFKNDYDLIVELNSLTNNYFFEIIKSISNETISLDTFGNIYNFSKQFQFDELKVKLEEYIQVNFDSILKIEIDELKRINSISDNFIFELLLKERNSSRSNEQQLLQDRNEFKIMEQKFLDEKIYLLKQIHENKMSKDKYTSKKNFNSIFKRKRTLIPFKRNEGTDKKKDENHKKRTEMAHTSKKKDPSSNIPH